MLHRRALLAATGSALALPALAQGRSRLVVMTYGGGFEAVMRDRVKPAFEAANPFDVTLVVSDDTALVPKLVASRGRPPFDVFSANDDAGIMLRGAGLLAPDQSARLPELADAYPSMRPPHTVIYGTTVYQYDLVYRTAAFPAAPASWQDLWKPGITVGVPYVSQSYGLCFLYLAALLNGGSAANLDPGFVAIKRLSRFKVYKNVSQGLTLFQQGEIDAALYYSHRGQQLIDMGLPVGRTVPKEGVFAQRTGTQIPKGAANMDGAVAWVRASLSVPYQAALMEQLYSPANTTVPIPPALTGKLITGAAEVAALRDPPWEELLPQRDAILDRWTREFG